MYLGQVCNMWPCLSLNIVPLKSNQTDTLARPKWHTWIIFSPNILRAKFQIWIYIHCFFPMLYIWNYHIRFQFETLTLYLANPSTGIPRASVIHVLPARRRPWLLLLHDVLWTQGMGHGTHCTFHVFCAAESINFTSSTHTFTNNVHNVT